jgi:hypothetical protein
LPGAVCPLLDDEAYPELWPPVDEQPASASMIAAPAAAMILSIVM